MTLFDLLIANDTMYYKVYKSKICSWGYFEAFLIKTCISDVVRGDDISW